MANYGLQIRNASNVLVFDSLTAPGGWGAGVEIGTTSSIVRTYPLHAGRSGATYQQGVGPAATWDYALGYPRVTIPGHPTLAASYINMIF